MWKKEEEQPARPAGAAAATTTPEPTRAPAARSEGATIGPSIVIRGEVSGSEDLLIQGRIDGSVALEKHAVTVGGGGRVKANITGRVITVEGEVEGDLSAQEQIVLRGSSKVLGDITAPRVVLEDGASFRGLVDMGSPRDKAGAGAKGASKEGVAGSDAAKGSAASGSAGTKGSQASSTGSSSGAGSSGGGQGSASRSGAGSGRDASERRTGS